MLRVARVMLALAEGAFQGGGRVEMYFRLRTARGPIRHCSSHSGPPAAASTAPAAPAAPTARAGGPSGPRGDVPAAQRCHRRRPRQGGRFATQGGF
jgi:hypothetical protein